MATSHFQVEHPGLLQAAYRLLVHLQEAGGRLTHGPDMYYFQHGQFAERLESLHLYLHGALSLLALDGYMAAFAVLRSALEHHVQDHLLFLGDRFRVIIRDVTDETLQEWADAIRLGDPAFASVLKVRRVGKTKAELIRSGPHFTDGGQGPDAPSMSIYYGIILDHFDPFTGGRSAQDFIGDWAYRTSGRQEVAARSAALWREMLSWTQLKENLGLNGFYTEAELARWEVHFSFLSAFTHPTARAIELLYGHNSPKTYGFDHFASELGLLYVVTIARLELEIFEAMTRREPIVNLRAWDEVRTDLARSAAVSAHLWFPRGSPHPYDKVQEANHRGTEDDGTMIPRDERERPEDLQDDEVLYYANPLKRIVALHTNEHDLFGFPYASPWPRVDASPFRR